mmetsp:Transcript_45086/g.119660  ORF Transcript_45086/g.119660 Transcript_45086/m.119660 type:complete len:200 (+) Transcript_45086:956-1555(+)
MGGRASQEQKSGSKRSAESNCSLPSLPPHTYRRPLMTPAAAPTLLTAIGGSTSHTPAAGSKRSTQLKLCKPSPPPQMYSFPGKASRQRHCASAKLVATVRDTGKKAATARGPHAAATDKVDPMMSKTSGSEALHLQGCALRTAAKRCLCKRASNLAWVKSPVSDNKPHRFLCSSRSSATALARASCPLITSANFEHQHR